MINFFVDIFQWHFNFTQQAFYKQLINLKKENKDLWNGSAGGDLEIIDTTEKSVLAYIRVKEKNKVIFIGNFTNKEKEFSIKSFDGGGNYKNYFSDEEIIIEEGTQLDFEPWEYFIFVSTQ